MAMKISSPRLPLAGLRALSRLGALGAQVPVEEPGELLRRFRNALGMTQAQLAKRAGMPQSHLARMETGKVDPQLGTWKRLFKAFSCELVVLPRLEEDLGEFIANRAKEKARLNVARVSGTMALEKQLPDDTALRALLRAEEARLLSRPSSELWED